MIHLVVASSADEMSRGAHHDPGVLDHVLETDGTLGVLLSRFGSFTNIIHEVLHGSLKTSILVHEILYSFLETLQPLLYYEPPLRVVGPVKNVTTHVLCPAAVLIAVIASRFNLRPRLLN